MSVVGSYRIENLNVREARGLPSGWHCAIFGVVVSAEWLDCGG